jgi:hypothetical protein
MRHVTSDNLWPPPDDWTEVIVLWSDIMDGPRYPIKQMLEWTDNEPGGEYHLHGYNSTEGFSFRFRNFSDAVHFTLRWL